MKNGAVIKAIVMTVLAAIVVLGLYLVFTRSKKVGPEESYDISVVDEITTTNLEKNYVVTRVYGKLTVSDAVVPPTPTPTPTPDPTPTPIDDTPTPTAPAPAPVAPAPAPLLTGTPDPAVLGAQRDVPVDGPAVLGARRAGTDDTTSRTARAFVVLVSAAVALSLLISGKKKREN